MYENDSTFRLEVNMIPALAFVPAASVPAAFSLLSGLKFIDHLLELLAYFEKVYVGEPLGNGSLSFKNVSPSLFKNLKMSLFICFFSRVSPNSPLSSQCLEPAQ
jgi:hypothetical protein